MPTLGDVLLAAALALAVYGIVVTWLGVRRRDSRLWWSGQGAAVAVAILVSGAVATLEYLLVTSNFAVADVAEETSRGLSLFYKMTALWAGNAGSLLFWVWILSLYTAFIAVRRHRDGQALVPYALPVLLVVITFFLGLENFVVRPFALLPAPAYDGGGLNPLLQNVWMVIHPPNLYLGLIGMTIPFAFAIGALVKGQMDATWVRMTRRWTLVAWMFLTAGLLLGGYWAYIELGWGGYWAWDPVENSAFMPWLAATAFLHSSMVQERRGMFKAWNVVLIVVTWLLTILGTMLTRSGILVSIHAFTGAGLAPYFGGLLAVAGVGSLALIIKRRALLVDDRKLEAAVSRESSFLLNNFLLLAATVAILWGTMFPLVSRYLLGQTLTVSTGYFDAIMAPVGLVILLLLGLGPLIAWGRVSWSNLVRHVTLPVIVGVAAGASTTLWAPALYGTNAYGADLALGGVAFTLTAVASEFYRAVRARRALNPGQGILGTLWALIDHNRQRYGGYIIHIGTALLILGIVGSFYFTQKATLDLTTGQRVRVGAYTVRYLGNRQHASGEDIDVAARLRLGGGAMVTPGQVIYPGDPQPVARVAIHSTPVGDFYTVLTSWSGSNHATVEFVLNPLISWIWIGGMVMVLGTLLALGVGGAPATEWAWTPPPLLEEAPAAGESP